MRCELGEGPAWDDRTGTLYQAEHRQPHHLPVAATGAVEGKWTFASPVGSLGLTESGKLVVALRHTVGIFDPADGSWRAIAEIETEKGNDTRLNDARVGPDGAFWVGCDGRPRHAPARGTGRALSRYCRRRRSKKSADNLQVSNGLAFSPDGKTMFIPTPRPAGSTAGT